MGMLVGMGVIVVIVYGLMRASFARPHGYRANGHT